MYGLGMVASAYGLQLGNISARKRITLLQFLIAHNYIMLADRKY